MARKLTLLRLPLLVQSLLLALLLPLQLPFHTRLSISTATCYQEVADPVPPLTGRNATIEVSWASQGIQERLVPETDGQLGECR